MENKPTFMHFINQVRLDSQQGQPLNEEAMKGACNIYLALCVEYANLLEMAKKINADFEQIVRFNNSLGDTLADVCMAFHSNDTAVLAQAVAVAQRRFVSTDAAAVGIGIGSSASNSESTSQTVH